MGRLVDVDSSIWTSDGVSMGSLPVCLVSQSISLLMKPVVEVAVEVAINLNAELVVELAVEVAVQLVAESIVGLMVA